MTSFCYIHTFEFRNFMIYHISAAILSIIFDIREAEIMKKKYFSYLLMKIQTKKHMTVQNVIAKNELHPQFQE